MSRFIKTHGGGLINVRHIATVMPDGMSVQTAKQIGTSARIRLAEPFDPRTDKQQLDDRQTEQQRAMSKALVKSLREEVAK